MAVNTRTYASMVEFVTENPDRLIGDEIDFGIGWWDGEVTYPQYRVSWIAETGELYAFNLTHPAAGGGQVELLGVVDDIDDVRRKLDGWHDVKRMELAWVRDRLAGSNLRVIERLRAESGLGESLAASVEAWERQNKTPYPNGVPYPGFCKTPAVCCAFGRCKADTSCVD